MQSINLEQTNVMLVTETACRNVPKQPVRSPPELLLRSIYKELIDNWGRSEEISRGSKKY